MTKNQKPKKVVQEPKSIRQAVKTIVAAVKKNDGITQFGIIYVQPNGQVGFSIGTNSELFENVINRAAEDVNRFNAVYHTGFTAGQDSVFHPNPAR